jgi:hypothetical protein
MTRSVSICKTYCLNHDFSAMTQAKIVDMETPSSMLTSPNSSRKIGFCNLHDAKPVLSCGNVSSHRPNESPTKRSFHKSLSNYKEF